VFAIIIIIIIIIIEDCPESNAQKVMPLIFFSVNIYS